jgi:probable F420-dependent oxidoreductase
VRLGIATPIVVRFPGTHADWEREAGIAELAEIAVAGERLGYHHISCSEHVAVPAALEATRGATYWDPLATLGYLAARTERLRLLTNVLVLGYHHPLDIAKRYGTLDRVCGGRLIIGVGVGSLREEFDLLGASFDDRGPRADDAMAALRASLSRQQVSYDGTYYDYRDFVVDPHAVQERVPLWVGGRTRRSLRRAVTLGDGWVPFALTLEQAAAMLASFELPDGFDVALGPDVTLDPAADPSGAEAALERLARAGTTVAIGRVVHTSLAHYLEQMEALAAVAAASAFAGDA